MPGSPDVGDDPPVDPLLGLRDARVRDRWQMEAVLMQWWIIGVLFVIAVAAFYLDGKI